MGVFDEGCMGMYNAIIPDELLQPTGVYKERLSQSTLYAKMLTIADDEARGVYEWLVARGMKFDLGTKRGDRPHPQPGSPAVQDVHCGRSHCRRVRVQHHRHPVSAGAQGPRARLRSRPRACSTMSTGPLCSTRRREPNCNAGDALPHFNEVDECAGLDGLVTNRTGRNWVTRPRTPCTTCAGPALQRRSIDDYVGSSRSRGGTAGAFDRRIRGTVSERAMTDGGGTEASEAEIVWSLVRDKTRSTIRCSPGDRSGGRRPAIRRSNAPAVRPRDLEDPHVIVNAAPCSAGPAQVVQWCSRARNPISSRYGS